MLLSVSINAQLLIKNSLEFEILKSDVFKKRFFLQVFLTRTLFSKLTKNLFFLNQTLFSLLQGNKKCLLPLASKENFR